MKLTWFVGFCLTKINPSKVLNLEVTTLANVRCMFFIGWTECGIRDSGSSLVSVLETFSSLVMFQFISSKNPVLRNVKRGKCLTFSICDA